MFRLFLSIFILMAVSSAYANTCKELFSMLSGKKFLAAEKTSSETETSKSNEDVAETNKEVEEKTSSSKKVPKASSEKSKKENLSFQRVIDEVKTTTAGIEASAKAVVGKTKNLTQEAVGKTKEVSKGISEKTKDLTQVAKNSTQEMIVATSQSTKDKISKGFKAAGQNVNRVSKKTKEVSKGVSKKTKEVSMAVSEKTKRVTESVKANQDNAGKKLVASTEVAVSGVKKITIEAKDRLESLVQKVFFEKSKEDKEEEAEARKPATQPISEVVFAPLGKLFTSKLATIMAPLNKPKLTGHLSDSYDGLSTEKPAAKKPVAKKPTTKKAKVSPAKKTESKKKVTTKKKPATKKPVAKKPTTKKAKVSPAKKTESKKKVTTKKKPATKKPPTKKKTTTQTSEIKESKDVNETSSTVTPAQADSTSVVIEDQNGSQRLQIYNTFPDPTDDSIGPLLDGRTRVTKAPLYNKEHPYSKKK